MGHANVELKQANLPAADHPTLHGGDLLTASQHYNIPLDDWLDLSTGISPFAYPFTPPPASAFQRLPYPDPKLQQCAADHYQHPRVLVTAGSQPVIQALPLVLPEAPVLVPDIGYREHAQQWAAAGRLCRTYPALNEQATIDALDDALTADPHYHLVIINPNNPSGTRLPPGQLQAWAQRLAPGCFLIVDEAFIDVEPEYSVLPGYMTDNIIVLRSFGKFFGLAGLRLGFVVIPDSLQQPLQTALGLWSVNGPAQAIALQALADTAWQNEARLKLNNAMRLMETRLAPLIEKTGAVSRHSPLFSSLLLLHTEAAALQEQFARQGILLRLIHVNNTHSLVRIGRLNPDDTESSERFVAVLDQYTRTI